MSRKLFQVSINRGSSEGKAMERARLVEAIKHFDGWLDYSGSCLFVVSEVSANEICAYLSDFLSDKDKIIVSEVAKNAAWMGLNQEEERWLKNGLEDGASS